MVQIVLIPDAGYGIPISLYVIPGLTRNLVAGLGHNPAPGSGMSTYFRSRNRPFVDELAEGFYVVIGGGFGGAAEAAGNVFS